jgi:hypothetical protein
MEDYALKQNVVHIERQVAGLTTLEKFNKLRTETKMRFKIV